MVFNDIVSGLSNSLWATKSMLPSMGSFIMMVGPKTHMFNLAVGVTFYSFKISLVLKKYCGVDSGYYLEPKKDNQGTYLWRLRVTPHDGSGFVSLFCHTWPVIGK